MAWTTFKSTDASAPTLNGTTGSLITVLDAVLVNGYGAKAAAGWTKAFSGTSKAAYRNSASSISRTFVQVLDNGPGSQTFKEARLRLYGTMSDVDTGTLPTPTVAQSTPGLVARKSTTLDSTARAWIIFADDRTAIICLIPADSVSAQTDLTSPIYLGDPYAYLSADAQGAVIAGRFTEAMTTMLDSTGMAMNNTYGSASSLLGYIAGSHTGVAGSAPIYGMQPPLASARQSGTVQVTYPNEADGCVYIVGPLQFFTNPGSSIWPIRGHLRGIAFFCHLKTTFTAWDTATGAGDLTGHSYILNAIGGQNVSSGTTYQQVIAFETTTPAASS